MSMKKILKHIKIWIELIVYLLKDQNFYVDSKIKQIRNRINMLQILLPENEHGRHLVVTGCGPFVEEAAFYAGQPFVDVTGIGSRVVLSKDLGKSPPTQSFFFGLF